MRKNYVPAWILCLPPGNYPMAYLLHFAGLKNRGSTHVRIMKFGARLTKAQPSYHNIYCWDGYDYHCDKSLFLSDNGYIYRYQAIRNDNELRPKTDVLSTEKGWFRLVAKIKDNLNLENNERKVS
jgi:hypothetical protein